jgi:adenylate cyclase
MQTTRATQEAEPVQLAAGLFSSSEGRSAGRTPFHPPRKKNTLDPKNFFVELRRRNVYRVGVAYGVVSWLLIQIATQVFPFFEIPNWATRMVIVFLLLGFPVAVVLAWAYELTPEGLQRTDEVDSKKPARRGTGRPLNVVIIGVLVAVIAIMAWQHYRPARQSTAAGAPERSIAILPFVDLSQTRDQEYFTDGITEQIIDSLAHVHGLFVVARTTAFAFKNKNMDIREIGRQLGVSHVLEGSVRHGTGKVRIVAQLIDVANGFHLWGETYDSTEQDLFSLQSDVARKVASALQIELHLAEATQLAKPLTQNPEAYDSYLRGRYLLEKRTVDSIQKGRALFEEAVAKDPRFALGHAGIADSYILLGKLGAITSAEVSERAWPEVSSALTLDENLAEGYVSRGILLTDFEWNWPAAEADFRKALEINSNSASAHHWYALHLGEIGRFAEAMREIGSAEKLDSLDPGILSSKAKILCAARRYEEAIAQCRKTLDLEGNFGRAVSILAQAYVHNHQYPEGIKAAQKYAELSSDSGWAKLELAYAYAAAGNKAESERIVNEVTSQAGPFSPYDMATICAAGRDSNGAMNWLEKAIERRSVDVIWIRVDPRLDPARSDPRFTDLLARLVPRR